MLETHRLSQTQETLARAAVADVKRPLGSPAPLKVLLIPIAIVAFIVFLIVLGAIGLGVAFLVIATRRQVLRALLGAGGRRVSRVGRRQRT